MIKHPIFDNSTHDFDAGFKSNLVCKDLARHEVREKLSQTFDYDHIPATNPTDMSFFAPCSQTRGGLCSKHECADIASLLTHNLYELGGRGWKSVYPVLLQISDPHDELVLWWWLGKFVGKGQLAFLTPATMIDDGSGERRAEVKAGSHRDRLSTPIASHKVFADFLLAWQRGQGAAVDFHQLDALQVRRWKFKRDTAATTFRVVLESECTEAFHLSCKEKVNVKKSACESTGGMFSLGSKSEASWVVVGKPTSKSTKSKRVDEEPKRRVRKMAVVDDGSDCSAAEIEDSDGSSSDSSETSEARSEHRSSQSGDGDSAASEVEDDDADLDHEPWNSIGIKSWEIVPARASAKCEVCKRPIMQTGDSQIRFDYRFRVSDKLGDQKRIHASCASSIPAESRERDMKILKRWLRDPSIIDAVKLQLRECLESLRT